MIPPELFDCEAEHIFAACIATGLEWPVEPLPLAAFADPLAADVFEAACAVRADGREVTEFAVVLALRGKRTAAEVSALTSTAPTSAHFPAVDERVRDLARRRALFFAGEALKIAATAEDPARDSRRVQSSIDSALVGARSALPEPVGADELCARPPETPPVLIDGALYRGGTMLLAGPSKAAKSWTMLDLGLAVASGAAWMGFGTSTAAVLYLNFELPAHVAEKRVQALCKRRGIDPPSRFIVWNLRGFTLTIDDLERELPGRIARLDVGLVVIDPHYKLSATSGAEENSNDQQGALLSRLEALTSRNGAALSIAHHFAKGSAAEKNAIDRASGGGVFARWPDAFISLTPHEEEGAMTLDMILRAFPPVPSCVVRWEFPAWVRDDGLDPARLKRAGRPAQFSPADAFGALTDGMSNAEWRKALGWADSTFRRNRDQLIEGKRVRETSGLFYRVAA